MYYIQDTLQNIDTRLDDVGFFGISCAGDDGVFGTLYVKYRIHFYNPRVTAPS